jgi:hypothetical protein
MLTSLVGKVERVFVIGTPLSRVSNEEWRAAYKVLTFDPVHLLKHSQCTLTFQSVVRWSVRRLPGDWGSVMTVPCMCSIPIKAMYTCMF